MGGRDFLVEGLLEAVDLVVLGLDDAVESLDLLGEHGDPVFVVCSLLGGVAEPSSEFFVFIANDFKLVVQLCNSICR